MRAFDQRLAERLAHLPGFLLQPLAGGLLARDGVPRPEGRLVQQLINVRHPGRGIARNVRLDQCGETIVPHACPSLSSERSPAGPARVIISGFRRARTGEQRLAVAISG